MQKLDTIGALFANSWKRFGERFSVTAAIFAAPAILLTLSRLLMEQKTLAGLGLGLVIEILAVVASIIASLGLVSAYGKNTNFAESFAVGIKLFWANVWIAILVCLALFGGFIMLIIPGIILMVQLAFTNYTLVLEDKHGMAALAQSRTYAKGYWWAIFGRTLLLILIFIVAEIVIIAPLTLLLGAVGGTIIDGFFLLFLSPFAVSYQYEVFHNLRRLKSDVAEQAAKSDQGLVKVSMVVGIIGAVLVPILIVAALAFWGSKFAAQWHAQYPNGYQWSSAVTATSSIQIDPLSGPVGISVTISGVDASMLGTAETVLMDNLVAERNVPVANDGSFTFTVPGSLGPNCGPGQVCPQFLMQTSPKTYSVSIEQSAKDPNPISVGSFTVTSSSTAAQPLY